MPSTGSTSPSEASRSVHHTTPVSLPARSDPIPTNQMPFFPYQFLCPLLPCSGCPAELRVRFPSLSCHARTLSYLTFGFPRHPHGRWSVCRLYARREAGEGKRGSKMQQGGEGNRVAGAEIGERWGREKKANATHGNGKAGKGRCDGTRRPPEKRWRCNGATWSLGRGRGRGAAGGVRRPRSGRSCIVRRASCVVRGAACAVHRWWLVSLFLLLCLLRPLLGVWWTSLLPLLLL